jgi:hypothetical protein
MFEASEYKDATIFGNDIMLPTNYYLMDSSATFSLTKVRKICDDLRNALPPNTTNAAGLIRIINVVTCIGFYEVVNYNFVSITLSFYGNQIYLIGLNNNVEYSKTVTGA